MTVSFGRSYAEVLTILEHKSHSLKTLARLSGYDPFTFYRGADLAGLDLTDQDLTGLNFDQANLQKCTFDNVRYDMGAFNNSIISDDSGIVVDKYDGYFEDIRNEHAKRVYLFIRLRPELVDTIAHVLGKGVSQLANEIGISRSTLKKASNSGTISYETCLAISKLIEEHHATFVERGMETFVRQPLLAFYRVRSQPGMEHVTRENYLQYLETARRVYLYRRENNYPDHWDNFKDGPTMLEFYRRYFFGEDGGPNLYDMEVTPEEARHDLLSDL